MHSDSNKIGIFEAIAYCLGDIIGSGIFVSPTSVLQHSGSVGLSLIMWTIGALIALFGALVYIELGTSIRKSGCDFAYLTHVKWNPIAAAFLFVATTLTYPAILSIHTMAFGEYFVKGINEAFNKNLETSGNIPRLVGFTALLPLAFINLFSLKKFAGRFQIVATIVKFLVILIIIGTGFWFMVVKGRTENFHNSFNGTSTNPNDIILGLYNGLFAYDGFDVLNFGTEEIDNPRRTLPIAVFVGIGLSAFVYISMNLAYFSILSVEEFKASNTMPRFFYEYKEEKPNTVFVVTGANRGLGYGIVEKIAVTVDNGIIYITALEEADGKEAVETLKDTLGKSLKCELRYCELDIVDEISCQKMANRLKEAHGGFDVLINNAGIALPNAPPAKQAQISVDINYYGTKRIILSLLPLFRTEAKIITICSQKGVMKGNYAQRHIEKLKNATSDKDIDEFVEEYIQCSKDNTRKENGFPESGYGVSKTAAIALAFLHHRQYKNLGLKFYACCPGYVNTVMTNNNNFLSIQDGADTPFYLATDPDAPPEGSFVYLRKPINWY